MIEWLNLPTWVTHTLKACFHPPYTNDLVFKRGTSLSKAWGLIERFSEDIDLVMNREPLNFSGELIRPGRMPIS